MGIRPSIYAAISRPIRGTVVRGGGFTGLLDDFLGAAFATAHIALGRNWLSNATDEVRRSSDSDTDSFTEGQILNGQMLGFVNHDTTSLYNSARYFDGTTSVTLDSEITVTGDFSIDLTLNTETTSSKNLLGSSANSRINTFSGNIFIVIGGVSMQFSGITSMTFGEVYQVNVSRTGSSVTVTIDGLGNETATISSDDFLCSTIGGVTGLSHSGLLYAVNINSQAAYTGLGTSVTAWEDTEGSNDGTETNGAAYTGQHFDGFVSTEYDQSGVTVRDATQATTTEQPKIVDAGAVVLDGNGNVSTLWDGVDDDLDVLAGFAGLTSANVYAITDNAGVVTIDTLTAQDISLATNLSTILTSLTYDKVTAVVIYPDATDQAGIEAALSDLFE